MRFLILFLGLQACLLSKSRIVEEMKEKIADIGLHKGFVYVDLGLTSTEFDVINRLKIEPSSKSEYNRFGSLNLLDDYISGNVMSSLLNPLSNSSYCLFRRSKPQKN